MIGRVPDPGHIPKDGEPRRVLYVPLALFGDVWRPIQPPLGGHVEPFAAAEVCALHVRKVYMPLLFKARTVHALCTRSDFLFDEEIVDADFIREHVEQWHAACRAGWSNIDKLLDEPGPDDIIRIDGRRMRLDDDGILVVDDGAPPEPEPLIEPDPSLFGELPRPPYQPPPLSELISLYVDMLEQTSGKALTPGEIDEAIARLQQLRADRAGLNADGPAAGPVEEVGER